MLASLVGLLALDLSVTERNISYILSYPKGQNNRADRSTGGVRRYVKSTSERLEFFKAIDSNESVALTLVRSEGSLVVFRRKDLACIEVHWNKKDIQSTREASRLAAAMFPPLENPLNLENAVRWQDNIPGISKGIALEASEEVHFVNMIVNVGGMRGSATYGIRYRPTGAAVVSWTFSLGSHDASRTPEWMAYETDRSFGMDTSDKLIPVPKRRKRVHLVQGTIGRKDDEAVLMSFMKSVSIFHMFRD